MPDRYLPCPAKGCNHAETVPPDAEPLGEDDPTYSDLWDHVAAAHAEGSARLTSALMADVKLIEPAANPGDTKPGNCPICGPVDGCRCPKTQGYTSVSLMRDGEWVDVPGIPSAEIATAPEPDLARTEFARPFILDRLVDHSGVSGPGHVADGVEFPDGRVALRWRGPNASTNAHDDIDTVLRVHGHDGDTRVIWSDEVDDQSAPPADVAHGAEEQQASDVPEVDNPLLPGDVLRTPDETLLQFPSSPEVARAELSRIQAVARRYRDELTTVDAALRTAGIAQAGALGVSDLAARCRELTGQLTAVRAELIELRPAATPSTED